MSLKARKAILLMIAISIMTSIVFIVLLVCAFPFLKYVAAIFFVSLALIAGTGAIYGALKDDVFYDWIQEAVRKETIKSVDKTLKKIKKKEGKKHGNSET